MKVIINFLFLLLALPALVQAQFEFTTNDGSITITEYTGTNDNVVIPDETNGYPVTSIGVAAFELGASLTSVTIPHSVTSIGVAAFEFCTSLTSVTLGSGVSSLGSAAFAGCTSLISVAIPNSVNNIGRLAFFGCSRLTSVTIPDSVTSIGSDSFAECTSLTNITVAPDNPAYSSVGGVLFDVNQATLFQFPTGLGGNYLIPNSVTMIESGAFEYCANLTSVTIPNSVTSIGSDAFNDCISLTNITVDPNNPAYSSVRGILFDVNRTTLLQFPTGLGGNYLIPSGVITIESGAFEYCANLTSVTIPNSVTSIGSDAFNGCTSLISVIIGSGVTNVGNSAFFDCDHLRHILFSGNVPSLSSYDFYGDNATVYYLPETTGWTSTYGGLPALLWNPQVQTAGGRFGVQTNRFGFNITGTTNISLVVEASTKVAGGIWVPLQTNTLTSGSVYFSDPQWTNYPSRFYRFRSP